MLSATDNVKDLPEESLDLLQFGFYYPAQMTQVGDDLGPATKTLNKTGSLRFRLDATIRASNDTEKS